MTSGQPSSTRVAAVDLGATSVRVAVVDLAADRPEVEVLHRVTHEIVTGPDGVARWQWDRILTAVEHGLDRALEQGPIASIGVDGWAVDYGLLDEHGSLVAPPVSYRDTRTSGWQQLLDRIGGARLYDLTGIQLMPINTIFQLAAHDRAELDRARRLLLLPDLVVHHLTGVEVMERSNASTTALLDTEARALVPELLDAVDVDASLFAPLADAGTPVGAWNGVPVHLVGSHDTASAFLARPGAVGRDTALISSGTWVLVGTELPAALTSPAARADNFSNERGAIGDVRFLKNVMGFWLLERCRDQWGSPPIEDLIDAGAGIAGSVPTFDATDDRFLAPDDMDATIRAAAGITGTAEHGVVVRSILSSIAGAVADVLDELGSVTGTPITGIHVVGGGTRMALMNQLLADVTARPVTVGSPEATALGNALAQGLALGSFTGRDQAREWVAAAATRLQPR